MTTTGLVKVQHVGPLVHARSFERGESPKLKVLSGWLFAIVLLSTMTAVLVLNQNDGKRLELVQVLFRHGERTPSRSEYAKIQDVPVSEYEPYGLGQLTNVGRMQAYELGRTLRKRYKNYLDDAYKAEDLYAYSSDTDRTIMTMQLALAGLYPPTSSLLWNPDLNWLPIPYRYTPSRFDVLLRSAVGKTFLEILFRQMGRVIRAKNAKEYADIVGILEDKYGLRLTGDVRPDVLSEVYNVFHSHERMGIPLPEWCSPDVMARLKDYFVFDMNCYSYSRQLRRIHGGPLVKTFLDNMNVNETLHNPRKMYLYSGHDLNIAAVTRILGVKDFEYPDFMSAIIIEKLRDVDNRLYVRLVGRRTAGEEFETLKIDGCDELCPIEEFLRITEDVIPSEEELHHLENEFNESITDDLFLKDPYIKKNI